MVVEGHIRRRKEREEGKESEMRPALIFLTIIAGQIVVPHPVSLLLCTLSLPRSSLANQTDAAIIGREHLNCPLESGVDD